MRSHWLPPPLLLQFPTALPSPGRAAGSASLPGHLEADGPQAPWVELLCLGPHRKQLPLPAKQKPRKENQDTANLTPQG